VGVDGLPVLGIILPMGISFYTFHALSYSIDVFRRQSPPVRSFADFACYISLYPQLVAGPIIRYNTVADQLVQRTHSWDKFASGVSLFELTRAYSVFANQGFLVEPVFVLKIVDRDGQVLEEAGTGRRQVIEKDTAYIMTSLLESVVQHGTGQRVKALNRPAAGKTGTTNDMYDAWYLGYTREYIAGTWVGFDEEAPLGKTETGAVAAIPIWLGFMKRVLANQPAQVFEPPEGVVFAKIDAETGLLPVPESRKTIFECFKDGTVPSEFTKRPGEVKETEDFLKKDL